MSKKRKTNSRKPKADSTWTWEHSGADGPPPAVASEGILELCSASRGVALRIDLDSLAAKNPGRHALDAAAELLEDSCRRYELDLLVMEDPDGELAAGLEAMTYFLGKVLAMPRK